MSSDPHDEHDNPALVPFTVDMTPERIRFSLDLADGTVGIALTEDEWQELAGRWNTIIHKARPISDADLQMILPQINNIRGWRGTDQGKHLVTLVNIAKRADGRGYILRLWENGLPAGNEREWVVTTWGEFEAMEQAVREAHR